MTYELAKQLKDAGFPQDYNPQPAGWGGADDDTHNPTLEELILACADDFVILVRDRLGNWYAESEIGSTPTEAVAKLWLALHAV